MKLIEALSPAYHAKKFFGNNQGQNPANAAMPYLNAVGPMAKEQMKPYIEQGQQAQEMAQPRYNQMTQDPMGLLNEIQRGYTPSEGYNFRQDQAQKALRNSSAAGGYVGTEADNINNIDLVRRMLSQDQGEYEEKIMRLLGGGLQGQENAIGRGFGASTNLTDILGNTLGAQSSLAYKGQENQNETKGQWMKILAQLAGSLGGGMIGGPAGAMAGGQLGSALGSGMSGQNNSRQYGSNLYGGGMP